MHERDTILEVLEEQGEQRGREIVRDPVHVAGILGKHTTKLSILGACPERAG